MNVPKSPKYRIQQQSGTSKPATDRSMEWDVAPGRFAADSKSFHPGTANSDVAGEYLFPYEENEREPASLDFDLRRFVIGAWQRRFIGAVTVTAISSAMALVIAFSVSKSWQASTTLIKRSHQDRLSLAERDPFRSQDYSLATLLDTLKLPSTLDHVRKQAGLDVSLTALATAIDVSLGRDSKILNVKITWSNPEKSAELVNLLAQTFIDRTRLLLKDDASNAFEYYSAQLEETRQNARLASAEVLLFRQQHGISNLDAETKVLLEEMTRLQSELHSRRAEADALRVAGARLVVALESEPEQVIIYTIYRSPLKTRLAEYDWELREALSKYTEQNPKVIKLKERIDALKQMISENNDEAIPENTYSRNTKREEMELRLQLLGDDIKMREAQAGALEETVLNMKSKVTMLSNREKDYLLIQSQLDGILSLEKELARRVEETRLVMQRNEASFDIIETAAVPTEPLYTGRKLMAVVSLIFAFGGGIVLVVFLEWRDPLVRSARDVRNIIGSNYCREIATGPTNSETLLDQSQPISELANVYRGLCNDLDAAEFKNQRMALGIISVDPGAGRSKVAANLALTRKLKGQKVLLVDADLRQAAGSRPSEYLELPKDAGLYEHLLEGKKLVPQEDETDAVRYLSAAGNSLENDQGLVALGSQDLTTLLEPHSADRFTIVDLPPIGCLEVALEMATQLGSVLLVVRSGTISRYELKRCVSQLSNRGIDCLATILLDVPNERLENVKLDFFRWKESPLNFWSATENV